MNDIFYENKNDLKLLSRFTINARFTGGNNSHCIVSGLNCGTVVVES